MTLLKKSLIISPNMMRVAEKSSEIFVDRYIKNIPDIQLSAPFRTGKEIHALASYFLNGEDISKFENILSSDNLLLWNNLKNCKYFKFDVVETEYFLSARLDNYRIGGRIDAIVRNDKNFYILDYKTGFIPENPTYDFQTMVYLYCVNKYLKEYETLSFVYIGLKPLETNVIAFNEKLKKEYEEKLLNACLKITKY